MYKVLLLAAVLFFVGCEGEKTESEWMTAMQKLTSDVMAAYNAGDLDGLTPYMTDDIHSLGPFNLTIYGTEQESILYDHIQIEVDELRWSCGHQALFRCKTTYDDNGVSHSGDSLILVVDDEGPTKISIFAWNK